MESGGGRRGGVRTPRQASFGSRGRNRNRTRPEMDLEVEGEYGKQIQSSNQAPRRKNRVAPPTVLVHLLEEQKICDNLIEGLKMAYESILAPQLATVPDHPGSSVRCELASIMAETSRALSRMKEEIRVVRLGLSVPAKTGATRTKTDTEEEVRERKLLTEEEMGIGKSGKQVTDVQMDGGKSGKQVSEVQMDRGKSGKQVSEVQMDIGKVEMEVARILDSTFEYGLESDMPIIEEDPFPDDDKKEMNRGKSAKQVAEEEMAAEEKLFNSYREYWESTWGGSSQCGRFTDMTQVSPMYFTHLSPECIPEIVGSAIASATLQIFTIKLAEIKGGLKWPLSLYGVVAVRDSVDHNRNLLFSCGRRKYQTLSEDDPFLRLIGPSRAIVITDPVMLEIQLIVKGRTMSQDRALIRQRYLCREGPKPGVFTICLENGFCKTELCMERVEESVQATVVGIHVKNGSWPFEYGGQVACSSPSRTPMLEDEDDEVTYFTEDSPSVKVVLLASRGGTLPKDSAGYLCLSRHVVSVELEGSLKFFIEAYTQTGDTASCGEVCFMPKDHGISQSTCFLGDTGVEVEITVAWSLLVSSKRYIAAQGRAFECSDVVERSLTAMGL